MNNFGLVLPDDHQLAVHVAVRLNLAPGGFDPSTDPPNALQLLENAAAIAKLLGELDASRLELWCGLMLAEFDPDRNGVALQSLMDEMSETHSRGIDIGGALPWALENGVREHARQYGKRPHKLLYVLAFAGRARCHLTTPVLNLLSRRAWEVIREASRPQRATFDDRF